MYELTAAPIQLAFAKKPYLKKLTESHNEKYKTNKKANHIPNFNIVKINFTMGSY